MMKQSLKNNMGLTFKRRRNEFVIDDNICWMCGKEFDAFGEIEKRKTRHHSIPKRYKPYLNVLIPICQGCHYVESGEEEMYKSYYKRVRATFKRTEESIEKMNKKKEKIVKI